MRYSVTVLRPLVVCTANIEADNPEEAKQKMHDQPNASEWKNYKGVVLEVKEIREDPWINSRASFLSKIDVGIVEAWCALFMDSEYYKPGMTDGAYAAGLAKFVNEKENEDEKDESKPVAEDKGMLRLADMVQREMEDDGEWGNKGNMIDYYVREYIINPMEGIGEKDTMSTAEKVQEILEDRLGEL